MKYVVILVFVVVLVRIDVILKLFDKTAVKLQNTQEEIPAVEVQPVSELVPIDRDLSLKTSPYKTFLSMLNDFQSTADTNVKNKIIELLRANPVMFTDKLDLELEKNIFRMRDLLIQRDKVTHELLIEMMKSLKGENLEMMRRFLSYAIDIDMPEFFNIYSKTGDVNCIIMGYLGDNLSDDEKFNELNERLTALDAFLITEKAAPYKLFGGRCLLVLKLQVDKFKGITVPDQNPSETLNEGSTPLPETAETIPVTTTESAQLEPDPVSSP